MLHAACQQFLMCLFLAQRHLMPLCHVLFVHDKLGSVCMLPGVQSGWFISATEGNAMPEHASCTSIKNVAAGAIYLLSNLTV